MAPGTTPFARGAASPSPRELCRALYALGGFQSPHPPRCGRCRARAGASTPRAGAGKRPRLAPPCAEAVVLADTAGALHLIGGRSPFGPSNAAWTDQGRPDASFRADQPGRTLAESGALPHRAQQRGRRRDWRKPACGGRTQRGGGNTAEHEVYDPAKTAGARPHQCPGAGRGLRPPLWAGNSMRLAESISAMAAGLSGSMGV